LPYWSGYCFGKPLGRKEEYFDEITAQIMKKFSPGNAALQVENEDDFALLFEWTNQLDVENLGDYTLSSTE
jgi:hypothetical protein